nr:MAG TPA: hypothetical protein [Caudoviricetes sp.]
MSHNISLINIVVRTLQICLNIGNISSVRGISSPSYTSHRHE